jgi:hypothetical protein
VGCSDKLYHYYHYPCPSQKSGLWLINSVKSWCITTSVSTIRLAWSAVPVHDYTLSRHSSSSRSSISKASIYLPGCISRTLSVNLYSCLPEYCWTLPTGSSFLESLEYIRLDAFTGADQQERRIPSNWEKSVGSPYICASLPLSTCPMPFHSTLSTMLRNRSYQRYVR